MLPRENAKIWPLEFTATPETSPRYRLGGSLSGLARRFGDDLVGMFGRFGGCLIEVVGGRGVGVGPRLGGLAGGVGGRVGGDYGVVGLGFGLNSGVCLFVRKGGLVGELNREIVRGRGGCLG